MPEPFISFQKFNDISLANEIADRLKDHGIDCVVEDNQGIFDPSFANNTIGSDISIKLRPEDFTKAHAALEEYYQKDLENVEKDYYLFSFTDQELFEIVSKPDEWGHFDYQLAKKLLAERGKTINTETVELLKTKRYEHLAAPQAVGLQWIVIGYAMAVFWGVLGIIIGAVFAWFKKTLPNGSRVYVYRDKDRNHGVRMVLIGILFTSILFFTKFSLFGGFGFYPKLF